MCRQKASYNEVCIWQEYRRLWSNSKLYKYIFLKVIQRNLGAINNIILLKLKTYTANFMHIIPAPGNRYSCLGAHFRPFTD